MVGPNSYVGCSTKAFVHKMSGESNRNPKHTECLLKDHDMRLYYDVQYGKLESPLATLFLATNCTCFSPIQIFNYYLHKLCIFTSYRLQIYIAATATAFSSSASGFTSTVVLLVSNNTDATTSSLTTVSASASSSSATLFSSSSSND